MKAGKGRGGADLGHCPRGLAGMDEWMDSFQAALQLSVCVMGRGPQGQQSCCHQPSPARGSWGSFPACHFVQLLCSSHSCCSSPSRGNESSAIPALPKACS